MPNSSSVAHRPSGLRTGDVKTSLFGWGIYISALAAYCALYDVVVSDAPLDVSGSVIWALHEWGIWCFITPVAFEALRRFETSPDGRLIRQLLLAAAILLVSTVFRVAVDHLTEARGIGPTVIIALPRYAAALVAIFLIWHFFLQKRLPATVNPTTRARDDERDRYPDTLLVSKGKDKYPLQVDRIECISAAGNYVEILSANRLYLLRSTLKKVEELLPPSRFIRVHRSHIVNLDEIERIRSRPSGNGTVVLRSGTTVGLSKQHGSRLRKAQTRTN